MASGFPNGDALLDNLMVKGYEKKMVDVEVTSRRSVDLQRSRSVCIVPQVVWSLETGEARKTTEYIL